MLSTVSELLLPLLIKAHGLSGSHELITLLLVDFFPGDRVKYIGASVCIEADNRS